MRWAGGTPLVWSRQSRAGVGAPTAARGTRGGGPRRHADLYFSSRLLCSPNLRHCSLPRFGGKSQPSSIHIFIAFPLTSVFSFTVAHPIKGLDNSLSNPGFMETLLVSLSHLATYSSLLWCLSWKAVSGLGHRRRLQTVSLASSELLSAQHSNFELLLYD